VRVQRRARTGVGARRLLGISCAAWAPIAGPRGCLLHPERRAFRAIWGAWAKAQAAGYVGGQDVVRCSYGSVFCVRRRANGGQPASHRPPECRRCGRLRAALADSRRSTVWLVPACVFLGTSCEHSVPDSFPSDASAPCPGPTRGTPPTPLPGTEGRPGSLLRRRRGCRNRCPGRRHDYSSQQNPSRQTSRVARMRCRWPRRALRWLTVASG
jgi:hypothetical protein